MTTPELAQPASPGRPTPGAPAMYSPWIDGLCIGGLSIIAVVVFLALRVNIPAEKTGLMLIVDFLLNAPHFMVSYLVLYGVAQRVRDYPGVSKYVPLALGAYVLFALMMFSTNTVYLEAIFATAAFLLGWHYTGQAWGYTASYSFMQGIHFDAVEKKLIRTNLRFLLGWHVVWGVVVARHYFDTPGAESRVLIPMSSETLNTIYQASTVLAAASSLLGLAGLVRLAKRTGHRPTTRMLIPWVAVHAWYVLIYFTPGALFVAQNAHALQYLLFLMRLESNRKQRAGARSVGGYLILYYVVLVGLGFLTLSLVPDLVAVGFERLTTTVLPIPIAIVVFVNIHHFFIDNFIWKIRNPIVREDLFWHLRPERERLASQSGHGEPAAPGVV